MLYGNSKIKIVLILFLVVIGLSVGFAAFSNTLTISSSVDVAPSASDFNVGLSTTSGSIVTGEVIPILQTGDVEATNLIITNNDGVSSISGGSIKFGGGSPAVKYTFYAHNSGKYTAYLNSVTFNNVSGKSSFVYCEPLPGETSSSIQTDCSNLRYIISVGSSSYLATNSNINGHALAPGESEKIEITVIFGLSKSNSDFKFTYGTVNLVYSSVD